MYSYYYDDDLDWLFGLFVVVVGIIMLAIIVIASSQPRAPTFDPNQACARHGGIYPDSVKMHGHTVVGVTCKDNRFIKGD